jgi:hypothetical protein
MNELFKKFFEEHFSDFMDDVIEYKCPSNFGVRCICMDSKNCDECWKEALEARYGKEEKKPIEKHPQCDKNTDGICVACPALGTEWCDK